MKIHFYLRFYTRVGQTILVSGNHKILGNSNTEDAFALSYFDNNYWHGTVDVPDTKDPVEIHYRYIFREGNNPDIFDADIDRFIRIETKQSKEIICIDTWNAEGSIENAFYTKPFQQIFLKHQNKIPTLTTRKIFTHEFRVKVPLLNADELVCITGTGKMFKDWDIKKLLPLTPEKNWFIIKINLAKEDYPLQYKYGIYNTKTKIFNYEDGANRILQAQAGKAQSIIFNDGFLRSKKRWRGTGVAIPVFSLRSKNGFGTGEFNDIKLLADWAKQTGIKLLQLLPVNDTTSTFTQADSYPYAAVSAFALHPIYINLETVAGKKYASLLTPLNKKKKALNDLPDLDYEVVMKFKFSLLRELYQAQKENFLTDKNYVEFFELNKNWLQPYAVFCFLRDKNLTADFTKWKSNKNYSASAVQKSILSSPENNDEIFVHYFIQYHLHLQLKAVSEYAHAKGIVLKGDIPIGVSKNSCDVWVDPSLYNIDEQAGAPPDDFAVKGQNWGFPTYNWQRMQQDDFTWWRKRFAQMNKYFDAFRIDHILGFFRIWSIPANAVEGILGRFVPAFPVHINEFHKNNIWFDYARYCKPFINENILQQYGEKAKFITDNFLNNNADDTYELKEEFNTQKKVEEFFKNEDAADAHYIKQALYDLISNVILIEEENSQMQQFHFRIAMHNTSSFKNLDNGTQKQLSDLYINYFFQRQNEVWKKEALKKLLPLKRSTDMLICGEDLGMRSDSVEEVMTETGILSLEIQRMPKDPGMEFFHPKNATYLSVITPSTHDMSTIREWWQEDKHKTQKFYNYEMGHYGEAPEACNPEINKEIILQHLYSPAMWCIFQIQDMLGMSEKLRRQNPYEERINQPADVNHYWKYRMHLLLEDLMRQKDFNSELKTFISESGRA